MYLVLNEGRTAQCSPPEWDQHRQQLEDLYVSRGWTLPAIQSHMKRHHGFDASRDMYKRRFKQWGLRKNKKEDEMKAANWRRQQPDRIGKPTAVKIRGNLYTDADLDSYFKRRSKHTKRPPSPLLRPAEDVLGEMTCSTPKPGASPPVRAVRSTPEPLESIEKSSHDASASGSNTKLSRSLARLEPAKPASLTVRAALWPEIGAMSKSSSPERPISTPDPWKYQEPALVEISKLFDIAIQADPESMAAKFSDPTSDPRLHSLISAMHHFDIGNTYNALVHLKHSCAVLETSVEPLDLILMVDLTSSPSIFGDHRQRSSPTMTLDQHRSSLIVFMKHLQDVSSFQLGREHPISLLSDWLRKTESWMDLCYNICKLVTNRLIETLGRYHLASIKMQRRLARFPMYTAQQPNLDMVDASLTRLLEDCKTHFPESHPSIRHIKMELGFVLYMKGDWSRIIDLYQDNLSNLFNPPPPPASPLPQRVRSTTASTPTATRRISPSTSASASTGAAAFFSQPKMLCYEILQTTNIVAEAQEFLGHDAAAESTLRRIVALCHEEFGCRAGCCHCDDHQRQQHHHHYHHNNDIDSPPSHYPNSNHHPSFTVSYTGDHGYHYPPPTYNSSTSDNQGGKGSRNGNRNRSTGTTLWHTITLDVTKRLVKFLERRGRDDDAEEYREFLDSKEEESREVWVEGK